MHTYAYYIHNICDLPFQLVKKLIIKYRQYVLEKAYRFNLMLYNFNNQQGNLDIQYYCILNEFFSNQSFLININKI